MPGVHLCRPPHAYRPAVTQARLSLVKPGRKEQAVPRANLFPAGSSRPVPEDEHMRFRFVHAADLHLDTPFSGIGRVEGEVADELREASLLAFDALVDLALREEAGFLVLAGDIYDGPSRGLRSQLRLLSGLTRLSDAGIPVLAVHGNHDPLDEGWSAVGSWPEGVTFFGPDEPSAVQVARDGRLLATVYGVSFASRDERRNLARRFRRSDAPGIHVAVLHCSVGSSGEHEPYAPCSTGDLVAAGMDYWALGHVHRRRIVLQGGPWAVYPGNLQARSPQPGELGPKGAMVVEADTEEGVLGRPRFVPLDKVRFARLDLDVRETPDLAGLVRAVCARLVGLQSDNRGRGLVVRCRFVGEAEWADDLAEQCRSEDLLKHIRAETAGSSPFIWVDSLECAAVSPIDRDRLKGRGDFAAEVIAQSERLAASTEELAALEEQLRADLRAPARAALLDGVAEPALADLLQDAERLCLKQLVGGDCG